MSFTTVADAVAAAKSVAWKCRRERAQLGGLLYECFDQKVECLLIQPTLSSITGGGLASGKAQAQRQAPTERY
jgi:lysyl-tRNA synthetase class II